MINLLLKCKTGNNATDKKKKDVSNSTLSLGNSLIPRGGLIHKLFNSEPIFRLDTFIFQDSVFSELRGKVSASHRHSRDQNLVLCYRGYAVLPNKVPLIKNSPLYCTKLKKVLKHLLQ